MKLPEENEEVIVLLDNGYHSVGVYSEGMWFAGKGVYPSHEAESDILSGRVVGWTKIPEDLTYNFKSMKTKPN